jgi:membrane protease YdiL (CAAX protease family)
MLALWGVSWLRETAAYKQWEAGANWVVAMAAFQAQKFAVALIMVVVLLVVGRRMRDFFFTPGQLNAPIKALNPSKPQARRLISWRTLGLLLGLCIAPLTLLVFGVGNLPSASALSKALPFLPAALIFAATNAFSEETQYRAALLGDLHRLFGDEQAIWMTAIFFGFAHYFGGAPSGVPGVLITGLLGALFAKCMLDSKGILVPWFIHFCQNSVIYAFWAFGAMNA